MPTPTSHCRIADWRSFSFAGVVCPRPRLYIDADLVMRTQVTKTVLCRAALSTSSSSSVCASKYVSVAGSGSCCFTTGLRQRRYDRSPCVSDAATAVGSPCGCALTSASSSRSPFRPFSRTTFSMAVHRRTSDSAAECFGCWPSALEHYRWRWRRRRRYGDLPQATEDILIRAVIPGNIYASTLFYC